MNELLFLPAHVLHQKLIKKEFSCTELTRAYLSHIKAADARLSCYISLTPEAALASAQEADARILRGEALSPFEGIPLALKDNLCTQGVRTTCASRMLADFVPPYDASVVARLKRAGAVILGKTNMDEFGMGSSCEHSFFMKTKNPHRTDHVPGGSSGGSAAAVAAGMATVALGSDTGGSVRQPAAFCGVVGIRPTYGLLSRYGLIAFASSLDQVGPISRDVTDCANLLDILAFPDPKDSTSVSAAKKGADATAQKQEISNLTIGLPKEFFGTAIHAEVRDAVLRAAEQFERLGARVTECSLPTTRYALSVYYILSSAEAASNLARYDGVSYGFRSSTASSLDDLYEKSRSEAFGHEVKRRIMLGTYALGAEYYDRYYQKAQKARTLIKEDFDRSFSSVDLLLTPTAPMTAWKTGELPDGPEMYATDLCTVPAALAGIPALSMPCGTDSRGLPIGLQLMGPAFSERTLFSAAYALEQSAEAFRAPSLKGGLTV